MNDRGLLSTTYSKIKNPRARDMALISMAALAVLLFSGYWYLSDAYKKLESAAILDRNGEILTLYPNYKGQYVRYEDVFPTRVKELLLFKEDRFFYYHPGINPFSMARAVYRYLTGNTVGGSSTITQQLVKNLLGNEQSRTLPNKLFESMLALNLELFESKEHILEMYGNTVYMGNQIQGLHAASELYFNKELFELDDTKLAMLLATIPSPSTQNPWRSANMRSSRNFALRAQIDFDPTFAIVTEEHAYAPVRNFELASMGKECSGTCATSIDSELTNTLRSVLNKHVLSGWDRNATNGAIVVLKLPENELLAFIGTPNTESTDAGHQINMAIEPRPIGSTAKPFIYLAGFEKGLRPYTLVNDREYKFTTASGFPLYPKNYDGQYRGWVTLHTALSNSLNVPTVKTLEYVGLPDFYDFLEKRLGFIPHQNLDSYQYGIALGGLEMDALTLAHFLSIFPNNGILKPLHVFESNEAPALLAAPMAAFSTEQKVAEPEYIELVTRILNDRTAGVEQFGLASNLNLFQDNYAVKTGTSRDFHDSWTVGYTPDFLVVTWLGNAEDRPLRQITGQSGAGAIWNDTMEILLNSPYNKRTPLTFAHTVEVVVDGKMDIGLKDEDIAFHRNLLADTTLIQSPIDGDTFLFHESARIPLRAQEYVSWFSEKTYLGEGEQVNFGPPSPGEYQIRAERSDGSRDEITIHVKKR